MVEPVPVQVKDARGGWCDGFLLLEFFADGAVAIRSERTGTVKRLQQGQWRDPIEERMLLRIAYGGPLEGA